VTGRGCPSSSHRNENKKDTTGRAVPSLSCPNEKDPSRQNESNDTRRRGHAPPHRVEIERTWRGGGMRPPPYRIKKETWTRQGGLAPSPSCWNGKNATRRGISLLVALKRKREHDGEGWCPPRHVEVARTRWGGHTPPHRVKKEMKIRWGGHQPSPSCWGGKNAMRRGIPLLVASKRKREHDGEGW